MKIPFLSRRAEPIAIAPEPCTRLTKADLPPRRFDEAADSLRGDGSARRPGRRFFNVASTAAYLSWDVQNVSADHALYFNLDRIKARCRDLARNNDYARHFLRLLDSNVIGPHGFTLQGRRYAGAKRDKAFNSTLESHWRKAGKLKNAPSTDGKKTKAELASLWMRTLATDGEVFEVYFPSHSNRYRFASRIVDSTLIDWTKNELLSNGNRIKMGVEIDQHEKVIAYWVLARHPSEYLFADNLSAQTHQRITADRARLTFLEEFPGQTRGVSWLAAPAIRAQMLQKFEEAIVIASRGAAAKGGFYEVDEDYEGAVPGDEEGEDASEMIRKQVEPGEWELLPRGIKAKPYDPQSPPAGVKDMCSSMLRGIASGLGISYHHLANDLSGVNYSSARSGDLELRGIFRKLQRFVIDHHEEPYFCWWAKILRFNPDTPIDGRKLDGCLDNDEYEFRARGWDWVDPLKEVNAHEKAINLGLTTRTRVIAERTGEDIEDVLDELQAEREMMVERGLNPDGGAPKAPAAEEPPPEEDEPEE